MSLQEKETALHCAAVRGNLDCVRILLEHGAPINNTDKVPALVGCIFLNQSSGGENMEDSGGEKIERDGYSLTPPL